MQSSRRLTRSQIGVQHTANNIARARVYDLSQYTTESLWGPFMNDGSMKVDWEKMEAIMVLLGYNLRLFAARDGRHHPTLWFGPWEGVSPGSFPSAHEQNPDTTVPEKDEDLLTDAAVEQLRIQRALDVADPYGVTGTWMRVVCFLDYNDLYAFNFTNLRRSEDRERGIATREAIRLIRLKIKVTKIVQPSQLKRPHDDDSDSSSDFDEDEPLRHALHDSPQAISPKKSSDAGPSTAKSKTATAPTAAEFITATHGDAARRDWSEWPIVYFTGTSHSMHASFDPNANSRIRGVVRMTKHGDVRWTTWSIFHGEERWRSEGVQVGGPKSRRGVLGNWFDKDYEAHGPAGPTAFWKLSNDYSDEDPDAGAARDNVPPFVWRWTNGDTTDEDDNDEGGDGDEQDETENGGEDVGGAGDADEEGRVETAPQRDGEEITTGDREEEEDDETPEGSAGHVEIIDEALEGVDFELVPVSGEGDGIEGEGMYTVAEESGSD